MNRRDVLCGLVALLIPSARAQHSALLRIAVVHPSLPITAMSASGSHEASQYWRAFFVELERLGFSEGTNLVVERYSGEGRTDHYGELAKLVVRSRPDLVFVISGRMIDHLRSATETIPIVGITGDPMAIGLTPSLARPLGNVTGIVADAGVEIWGKRLALTKELVPSAARIGFLAPRAIMEGSQGRATLQIGVVLIEGTLDSPINPLEYARVFAVLTQECADALVVSDAVENLTHQQSILELVARSKLPALYPYRDFVERGGLGAYAVDIRDFFIRAAGQIAQILKGAKVDEIPFYQATTFRLIINLITAKALGLTVPPSLLARADEVIE
jgi:putative ABC transport system substrate-binding protein